jgi:iron-sulfur cluster assembly protein
MITITPEAAHAIKMFLTTQAPEALGVRLAVKGMGCSGYGYDMATVYPNSKTMLDRVFESGGIRIFVDQASFLYLDNVIVDFKKTAMGSGFEFSNPQAKSVCGCAKSFSV